MYPENDITEDFPKNHDSNGFTQNGFNPQLTFHENEDSKLDVKSPSKCKEDGVHMERSLGLLSGTAIIAGTMIG